MRRLGTRPDRKRTSSPPEARMSSFSSPSVVTDTGTSCTSSTRRWAVTITGSSVVPCAKAAGSGSAMAMAAARRRRASADRPPICA